MKLRNTTGMSQVVVLQGKKTIVEANGVIGVESDFTQIGFDVVDNSVAATVTAGSVRRRRLVSDSMVSQFEDKLQSALSDKDKLLEETSAKVKELAEKSAAVSEDVVKEFEELKELTLEMNKEIGMIKSDHAETKSVVFRRLEILKGAMQAMELELEQLYGDDTELGK